MAEREAGSSTVLFVDLDGTLFPSDCTHESFFVVMRSSPKAFGWALKRLATRGLGPMKRPLSQVFRQDPTVLPYIQTTLAFLHQQQNAGKRLVLATASDRLTVEPIAQHLGLFEDVLATDDGPNLKGSAKLEAMRIWARDHGCDRLGYVGDSRADVPIFEAVDEAYVVADARGPVMGGFEPLEVLHHEGNGPKAMLALVRPKRWLLNLLVFLPGLWMFVRGEGPGLHGWLTLLAACLVMMLATTFLSIAQALMLVAERRADHTRKVRDPLAAGQLGASQAVHWLGWLGLAAVVTALAALPWPASLLVPGWMLLAWWKVMRLDRLPLVGAGVTGVLVLWRIGLGIAALG